MPTPISDDTPVALTIAGSDCSSGAGIQADLKTLQSIGVHGVSAVTSIVSETPLEVRRIDPVSTSLLQSQIQILLESYPIAAIKTGMLPTHSSIIAVYELLKDLKIPVIIDPVLIASSGTSLIQNDAPQAMTDRLLPLSTIITPNLPEASFLLDRNIKKEADMALAAQDIAEKFNCSCLLKGGHLPQGSDRLDVLWHDGAAHEFTHPDAQIGDGIHGTGCALSSSIVGHLALGHSIKEATQKGITHIQTLISNAKKWHHQNKEITCLGW